MPISSIGSVSIGDIRNETLTTSTFNYSLNNAEDQVYFQINKCSPVVPSSTNPASLSEWRGYDHWIGCTCSTFGPTAFASNYTTPWTLNLGLSAPNGGFLTMSLTGMQRDLVNASFDGYVEVYLGPTYSNRYIKTPNAASCVTGTPDFSYFPMEIEGGITFPSDRTFNVALPAGTTAAQVRITCGGANSSFDLTGNLSISACGATSVCSSGIRKFYIGNKGQINFTDAGFTQSGVFAVYSYLGNINGNMKFSVRDSTGATSADIGVIACGSTASGLTATYVSNTFSIVEYLGFGGTATENFSILEISACPAPAGWNVSYSFTYNLTSDQSSSNFVGGAYYDFGTSKFGPDSGSYSGNYTTPASATNLGDIYTEITNNGIYLCYASISALDDAGSFCSNSAYGSYFHFVSCINTTTSANNCFINGDAYDY